MIQSCAQLNGSQCASKVLDVGTHGIHNGIDINPVATFSDANNIIINLNWNWYVWSQYSSATGDWSCPSYNCNQAYWRVQAWR